VNIPGRRRIAGIGLMLSEKVDELEEVAGRGWNVAGEYVDQGISGTKEKRPDLDRLMTDAHRRRFDAVIVWKFDRFARSISHLLRASEMSATNEGQAEQASSQQGKRSGLRDQHPPDINVTVDQL